MKAQVLHKHLAQYENCSECEFIRVQEPFWLEEAYSSAIAAADTGLVMRNVSLAAKVSSSLYWVLGERGDGLYLDAAGGYGMLTRMMRDLGLNFYWSDKYCENLMARGFEYAANLGKCRAVTAMEVMEHLLDPVQFVENLFKETGTESLIFTTELHPGRPPTPDWWYYAFPTGQHIGFFSQKTLKTIAHRLDLKFFTANGLHIFSRHDLSRIKFYWASRPLIARISSLFVRHQLGSKTMADHQQLMEHI
ncbi:MAG: methyltransferase domain-containing protein [Betaproteobacteria bacterium]